MSGINNIINDTFLSLANSLPLSSSNEETPPYMMYAGTALAMVVSLAFFCKCLPATVSSLFRRVSPDQYFRVACNKFDTKMLDSYLIGKNPKIVLNYGIVEGNNFTTLLIRACENKNPNDSEKALKFVSHIIKLGADVNAHDSQGSSPLHHALWNNNQKLASTLIVLGAQVNTPDEHGVYPLNYAARFGLKELVSSMIAKGANPAKPVVVTREDGKEDEYTPLSEAVENGHVEIAAILLAATVGSGVSLGATQHTGTMKIQAQEASVKRGNGDSLPHLATLYGHLNMVTFLLDEARMNLFAKNIFDETLLHYAAKYNQPDIMKVLLNRITTMSSTQKEEWLNSKDTGDKTALAVAANLGYFDMVKMLADAGADTSMDISTYENKNLALIVAAVCGKADEVERLIKKENANPHVTTNNGIKLAQLAAQNKQTAVLKVLEDHFAESALQAQAKMQEAYKQAGQTLVNPNKSAESNTVVKPDKEEE